MAIPIFYYIKPYIKQGNKDASLCQVPSIECHIFDILFNKPLQVSQTLNNPHYEHSVLSGIVEPCFLYFSCPLLLQKLDIHV